MNVETSTSAVPPHGRLLEMANAIFVSRVLWVTAELGLADLLAAGPRSAEELAATAGLHAPSLQRVLRALGMLGVVSEQAAGSFALTPLGAALCEGAPGCARSVILTFCGPACGRAFDEFAHSVRTGGTGFEKAFGVPLFGYLAEHPEDARRFSETMIGFHGSEPQAVAAAYEFGSLDTVIDVGGATGNLLAAVLAAHPHVKGVLFDLPHVVSQAAPLLAARGVAERATIATGDFFTSVPAGGDCYLLSHILHDWTEARCLTILDNVRRAMKPNGRLLVVEMVLPPGDAPHPGKLLDMIMLVTTGGKERTQPEYAELLARAGFRLTRVVPTGGAASVLEAVPG